MRRIYARFGPMREVDKNPMRHKLALARRLDLSNRRGESSTCAFAGDSQAFNVCPKLSDIRCRIGHPIADSRAPHFGGERTRLH